MFTALIATGAFIAILTLLVTIRTKAVKLDIRNSEIVLALIPVALWLILSGRIQEFAFGDFRIVAAIRDASKSPVAQNVTRLAELPVRPLEAGEKTSVLDIPELIRRRVQVLSFRLGHGGYWGPAIRRYLTALTEYPFFRYIVINNADGSFLGMVDADQLVALIRSPDGEFYLRNFSDWLNESDKRQLTELPGFLSAENALEKISDRRDALNRMNSLDVHALPVVDDSRRFLGIVERSKLTANILIEIAEKLDSEN